MVGSEEGLLEVDDAFFPFFEGLLHLFEERLILRDGHLLVDLRLILDLLGSLTETEGGDSLCLVEDRGAASDDEAGLRVTSQRFLQDAGELRISIGDMTRLAIGQGVNDQSKGGERLVNALGLLEYLAFGIGLPDLFRAGEIHQVELPRLGRKVRVIPLGHSHDEDGVRPRGLLVHVRYPDGAVVVSDRHQLEHLIFIPDVLFRDISNVDALRFVLMNLKVSLCGVQKVLDLLQVDLHHG